MTLAAERGVIKGLDGRKLFIRSPHAALNTQLQGAAAIVMKRGLVIFNDQLPEGAKFVANVHDEWQLEVDEERADMVGCLGVDAIKQTAEYYNLNCPLDGEYKVGSNWSETH